MERPSKRFTDLTDFVRDQLVASHSVSGEVDVRTHTIRRRQGDVTLEVTAAGDSEVLRARAQQAAKSFLDSFDIAQGRHQQSTQSFTVSRIKVREPRSAAELR